MAKSTDDRPSPPEAPTESASKIVDLLSKFLGVLVTAAALYSTLTKSPPLLIILLSTTLVGGFYVIFAGTGKGGRKYAASQRAIAKWVVAGMVLISIGGGVYYFVDRSAPVVTSTTTGPIKSKSIRFIALDGDQDDGLSPSRRINEDLNEHFRSDTSLSYDFIPKDTIGRTSEAVQHWGRANKFGVVVWGMCQRNQTAAHVTLHFELLDTTQRYFNSSDPVDMRVALIDPDTLTLQVDLQLKQILPLTASILPIQQSVTDTSDALDLKKLHAITQMAQAAVSYEKGSFTEVQPILDTLIKWNRRLHCMDSSSLYLLRGNVRGSLADHLGAQTDWKVAAESYRLKFLRPASPEGHDSGISRPITSKLTRSIAVLDRMIKVRPQEDFARELDSASNGATWQLSGMKGTSAEPLYQVSVSNKEVVFMNGGRVAARMELMGASMRGEFVIDASGQPTRKGIANLTVQSGASGILGTMNIGGAVEEIRFTRVPAKPIGLKPKILPHKELIKPTH